MTKCLPKWLMYSYIIIWTKIQDKPFKFNEIETLFPTKTKQSVLIILGKLRKESWILVKLDQNDNRKRIYKLKHPLIIFQEIAKNEDIDKLPQIGET